MASQHPRSPVAIISLRTIISAILVLSLALRAFAGTHVLRSGTPVAIHAADDISSGRVKTGDVVYFVVASPVKVHGVTVIEAGAQARGVVEEAKHASGLGRNGKLVLSISSVTAVDGSQIPLSARKENRGGNNAVLSVGLAVLVNVFAVFIQGREAVVRATRQFDVYVERDVTFRTTPGGPALVVAVSPLPTPTASGPLEESPPPSMVLKTLMCAELDRDGQPQEVATSFVPTTPRIYLWWRMQPLGQVCTYEVRFYHGTSLQYTTAATVPDGTDHSWAVMAAKDGFAQGEWHADILQDGQKLATQYFTIVASPTEK